MNDKKPDWMEKNIETEIRKTLNKLYTSPQAAFMDGSYKRIKEAIREAVTNSFDLAEEHFVKQHNDREIYWTQKMLKKDEEISRLEAEKKEIEKIKEKFRKDARHLADLVGELESENKELKQQLDDMIRLRAKEFGKIVEKESMKR